MCDLRRGLIIFPARDLLLTQDGSGDTSIKILCEAPFLWSSVRLLEPIIAIPWKLIHCFIHSNQAPIPLSASACLSLSLPSSLPLPDALPSLQFPSFDPPNFVWIIGVRLHLTAITQGHKFVGLRINPLNRADHSEFRPLTGVWTAVSWAQRLALNRGPKVSANNAPVIVFFRVRHDARPATRPGRGIHHGRPGRNFIMSIRDNFPRTPVMLWRQMKWSKDGSDPVAGDMDQSHNYFCFQFVRLIAFSDWKAARKLSLTDCFG